MPPWKDLTGPLPSPIQTAAGYLEQAFAAAFNATGGAALSFALTYHGPTQDTRLAGGHWGTTASGQLPNDDTVYRIGSVTKLFTAAQMLQLEQAGKLNRHDVVQATVPELHMPAPASAWVGAPADQARFTWAQLASHAAGLPRFSPCSVCNVTTAEIARRAAELGWVLDSAPGEQVSYSNFGFALLGRGMERLANKTWEDYVVQDIAGPLGMQRTSMVPPASNLACGNSSVDGPHWPQVPLEWDAPAGQMYSSVRDMTTFGRALTTADPTLLPSHITQSWLRTQVAENAGFSGPLGSGSAFFDAWGMPWEVYTAEPSEGSTHYGDWPFGNGAYQVPAKSGDVLGYETLFMVQPDLKISAIAYLAWGPDTPSKLAAFTQTAEVQFSLGAPMIGFATRALAYQPSSGLPDNQPASVFVGNYSLSSSVVSVIETSPGVLTVVMPPIDNMPAPGIPMMLAWMGSNVLRPLLPSTSLCLSEQTGFVYDLAFIVPNGKSQAAGLTLSGLPWSDDGPYMWIRD